MPVTHPQGVRVSVSGAEIKPTAPAMQSDHDLHQQMHADGILAVDQEGFGYCMEKQNRV